MKKLFIISLFTIMASAGYSQSTVVSSDKKGTAETKMDAKMTGNDSLHTIVSGDKNPLIKEIPAPQNSGIPTADSPASNRKKVENPKKRED